MNWPQRFIAQYLRRAQLVVEFQGITEEGLGAALEQEAIKRLDWVEALVFSEESTDREKIAALQQWFLGGCSG